VLVDSEVAWAWFAALDPERVQKSLAQATGEGIAGIGSVGRGIAGFRRSHAAALSAYRVARHTGRPNAVFSDVIPEAMGLADLDAVRGLVDRQMGRLAGEGPREDVLRHTLEVYLASGQTARSAAAKLGLTERTVANRLQTARSLLPPRSSFSSLELALALRLMPLIVDRKSRT